MARRKAKADEEDVVETVEKTEEPVEKAGLDDAEVYAAAEAYVLGYTRRAELNETLKKAVDDLTAVAKERGTVSFTGAPREVYDVLNTYRR